MKKTTLLSIALTLLSIISFAQNQKPKESGLSFGVNAGLTLPTIANYDKDSHITSVTAPNASFYLGGTVNIPISQMFSLQPGLSLINKGGQYNQTIGGTSYASKTNLLYLEIPVNIVVAFEAGPGKFLVGVGPYLSFALKGTNKVPTLNSATGQVTTVSNDVVFGSGVGQTKSVDFGFGSLGEYRFNNGIGIHAGSGIGLINIGNSTGLDTYNLVTTFGLTYTFGKK
ncbi:MAG: PorT family protein [Pedobacter sp.]|nr:MAG: PorT family protein [Pedobacter sp.]